MQRSKILLGLLAASLAGCVTSRVEDARETVTGLNEGESVVIMTKSYHQGNETEADYLECIESRLPGMHRKLSESRVRRHQRRCAPAICR
jgi:hypothetical protein